jgi:hypothetical protein
MPITPGPGLPPSFPPWLSLSTIHPPEEAMGGSRALGDPNCSNASHRAHNAGYPARRRQSRSGGLHSRPS